MKFHIGPNGFLGLIVLLVSAPIVAALGFMLWAAEVDFFRDPAAHPLLLNVYEGRAAELIFCGLAGLCLYVLRRRGVVPTDEGDQSRKRYSDRHGS